METFIEWLGGGRVYHITLLANIDGIAEKGLTPNAGGVNFQGYEGWSHGRNFMTNSIEGVTYWIQRIHDHTESHYESGAWIEDNWVESQRVPVVVRFKFNARPAGMGKRWWKDDEGQPGRDIYTDRDIPNMPSMEMWDGIRWKELDGGIDPSPFLGRNYDPYIREDDPSVPEELAFYWELKNPYPLPPS